MTKLALYLAATAMAGLATPALAQDATAPAAGTTTADPSATAPATGTMTADPAAAAPADTTSAPVQSDAGYNAPTSTDGFNPVFTGPRIEGFGGADFQNYDFGNRPAGAERHHTGGVAGALGGFDIGVRAGPLGSVVLGVFGSYALPTSNFCAGGNAACIRPEREVEGGARLGVAYNRFLLYVKGSYVNSSTKVQSRQPNGTFFNTYRLSPGWRAGVGAEYAVTEHAYVKVEYDYTKSSRFDLTPYGYAGNSFELNKNQALAGFGVRF